MGYTKPSYYSIAIGWSTTDPLDSTTYYAGAVHSNLTTTATYRLSNIPVKGVIRAITVSTASLTAAGTGEDIVMALRVNDTTDYAIATVALNGSIVRSFNNYAMNVPVVPGDYFELKITTPAWVTNPQGFRGVGTVIIECA